MKEILSNKKKYAKCKPKAILSLKAKIIYIYMNKNNKISNF